MSGNLRIPTAAELAREKTDENYDRAFGPVAEVPDPDDKEQIEYRKPPENPDDGLEFKPLAEGHKRFITTEVNGQQLRVRVPLHIWNDPRPHLVGQYARELEKMVKRARRGPGPGPVNKTNP